MKVKVLYNPHKDWAERKAKEISQSIKEEGWQLVDKGEDISIVIGGDGTLLYNKDRVRKYILIGHPNTFTKSLSLHAPWEEIKALVLEGKTIPLPSLEVKTPNGIFYAMFDIQFRSPTPESALRGKISFGNFSTAFLGDGVVVSTPIGSSAYTRAAGGPWLSLRLSAIAVTCIACPRGFQPSTLNSTVRIEGPALLVVDNKIVGKHKWVEAKLGEIRWEWVVGDESGVGPLL